VTDEQSHEQEEQPLVAPPVEEQVSASEAIRNEPAGDSIPEFAVVTLPQQPAHRPATRGQRLWLLLIALLIILLDQLTKRFIEGWLPLYTSWAPFPQWADLFQLTHTTNTGAAFGLFPSGGPIFAVVAVVVAIAIIFYNHQLPAGNLTLRTALGLQLGGAMGNLIDRARQGQVTDFFDTGALPIFNIADAAIVVGVILLALLMLWETVEARREPIARVEEAPAEDPSVVSRLPVRSPDEWTTG
jgi:signal peptidase II